jgi:hypothetical protein|tara:strand:+ start:52899 stop:53213 length:315 start_codon:yes stop_codon:yes gene_type:complete
MRILTFLLVVAVAALLFKCATANAHGEHEWINEGGYKNALGQHCCGFEDCPTVESSNIKTLPDGYQVTMPNGGVLIIPNGASYGSHEQTPRACYPGCLFLPASN